MRGCAGRGGVAGEEGEHDSTGPEAVFEEGQEEDEVNVAGLL